VIPINPADFGHEPPPPEDESRLRTPPHSVEAEHSTLGGLLLDPSALGRIADVVTQADFYRHEHRTIFGVIDELATAGQAVDVITVFEQLQALGKAQEVGGLVYLNELASCVPSATNIRRYAEIVAERATARAVIAAADEMAAAAFNLKGRPVSSLLDAARTKLSQIQEQRRVGGARRLPVLTGPQLIEEASSMTWLCDGIFPEQSLGMLYGASGTFKSFLALDAALHIVHGLPWLGRRTEQGPVLWIAAEGGKSFGHRVNAWHRARRLAPSKQLVGIPASIDLGTEAWRVVDAVQSTVAITPKLVVVDTLSQTYTAGGEENSATDMASYLREIGARFRDLWKCTVVVVHHSGHTATERPRGSSAIQANTDFLFGCWRDEKEMLATLSCQHMKDGDRFDDATFVLSKVDLGVDKYGKPMSHLAARHLSSAEEIEEANAAEVKAGRGGKNQLLLSLMQNGMEERGLKKAFYEDCGLENDEARRKAYYRARSWAVKSGFMEVHEGHVLTLKAKT
jgi:hypothetical protein